MDVWRRTSPGTDTRRDRDHTRVATHQASDQSTRDTPSRTFRPARGVFFSGEVKWLDVGTSVSFAIAADTHEGVIGTAAVHFPQDHALPVTPSAPSSGPRCATAVAGVSTADITSTRWKRRSTTSIR
jgi:hypothetical protein